MEIWLREHWPWVAGVIFSGGVFWASRHGIPKRLDAAFRRIDEEREGRRDLGETIVKGFAEILAVLRGIHDELQFQRVGHHQQMGAIAAELARIGLAMDRVNEHETDIRVHENRLKNLEDARENRE